MISDLHVELIFLYNKISVRLLEFGENSSLGNTMNEIYFCLYKVQLFRCECKFRKKFRPAFKRMQEKQNITFIAVFIKSFIF